MCYSYDITPHAPALGGGWKLRLLEDGEEVGGGVFPIDDSDSAGVDWFASCTVEERSYWLTMAASTKPADARRAYLLADAHADAERTAYDWLDSREPD